MGLFTAFLRISGIYKIYNKYLENQISKDELPNHIGIILDGNRRWAQNRSFSESVGHKMGADNAKKLLEWCHSLGIKTLTVYALSTENLERPSEEVGGLMSLIEDRLKDLLMDEKLHRYHIKVNALGNRRLLSEDIQGILGDIEKATSEYNGHFLNLALAYGGRHEIVDAVKRISQKCKSGELDPSEISQKTVRDHLYTSHLANPDPDMIIRTSGEERLSGFLLWQGAYSELIFLDVYWPEFRKIDLMRAIRTYQKRLRRFGK